MVLIQSDSHDLSTQEVIDWLVYYNCPFVRINTEDKVTLISFTLNNQNTDFEIKIVKYKTNEIFYLLYSEISFYWYRRGHIVLDNYTNIYYNNSELGSVLKGYVKQIEVDILYIIYHLLNLKPNIGNI